MPGRALRPRDTGPDPLKDAAVGQPEPEVARARQRDNPAEDEQPDVTREGHQRVERHVDPVAERDGTRESGNREVQALEPELVDDGNADEETRADVHRPGAVSSQ